MLWSAFTLAFLHLSKFTFPSSTHFNLLVHLSHSDISFTSDRSLSLQLKSSKTDPFLMGCSITLTPSSWLVCAVWAMHATWLTSLHEIPTSFISSQQGNFSLRTILHLQLQHLGFTTDSYASHSFCIGAATTATEADLPPLAYPDPWSLVQQLLCPIHQDTCFNTPSSSCPASHHP